MVVLDLLDRYLTRKERHGGQLVKFETVLFLGLVIIVYGAIQFGGLALAPQIDQLLSDVGGWVSRWLKRPLLERPISGFWLVSITGLLFYLSGLWDYLIHRFFSHSRRFWFTHEYHHLPSEVFVAMPGLSVRPFAVISAFPATLATVISAYALLVAFGLPMWDLQPLKLLLLFHLTLLAASHSSFLRRFWLLHHVMKWLALTTPQEHVLHHTVDLRGNYGNFTILWDRLFGTYLDPTLSENQGHALGLPYDQDFLGAITLGKLKLPKRLRERFQIGWYCNID